MKFIVLILLWVPVLAYGAAGTVNSQPIYAVPPGSSNVLIFDATLSEIPSSVTVYNDGNAQQTDISKISVYEDGASSGWDGDEKNVVFKSYSPFWVVKLSGTFSQKRIFVTVDISSNAVSERIIKPRVKFNFSDEEVLGLERKILSGSSKPQVPVAPLAKTGEAISDSVIRWHFLDLANNEFGFRIKNSSLVKVAEVIGEDLSYVDETGLSADTCYSGRRAAAFNDRGESDYSANFTQVCTLVLSAPAPTKEIQPPIIMETPTSTITTTSGKIITEPEDLNITIRQKIIEILQQLIQLLQQKITSLQANLYQAFDFFTNWLESRFQ